MSHAFGRKGGDADAPRMLPRLNRSADRSQVEYGGDFILNEEVESIHHLHPHNRTIFQPFCAFTSAAMACLASPSVMSLAVRSCSSTSSAMTATRWLHRYPRPSVAIAPSFGLRQRAFQTTQTPASSSATTSSSVGEKLVTEDVPMVFPTSSAGSSDKGKGRLQDSSSDIAKAAAERGEAVEPTKRPAPRRTLGLKSKKAAISLVSFRRPFFIAAPVLSVFTPRFRFLRHPQQSPTYDSSSTIPPTLS